MFSSNQEECRLQKFGLTYDLRLSLRRGPPHPPTIHLGVRRPERALSQKENIGYTSRDGNSAYQICHVPMRRSFRLVSQVPRSRDRRNGQTFARFSSHRKAATMSIKAYKYRIS